MFRFKLAVISKKMRKKKQLKNNTNLKLTWIFIGIMIDRT